MGTGCEYYGQVFPKTNQGLDEVRVNSGDVLLQRYHVQGNLGRGGMAEVYKVWDRRRATHLAMKVLRPDVAQDAVFIQQFIHEAQVLERLEHPNIVRFYGLERDGQLVFILMEYISGTSLREQIARQQKAFTLPQIVAVMHPICTALHYAHQLGMVHCDIKPGNILLEAQEKILLADFGIAQMAHNACGSKVHARAGSPTYMAPEQIEGLEPRPQTDIYALGILLFELLSGGQKPFTGGSGPAAGSSAQRIHWEQCNQSPPSLGLYNPRILPELEAIVMKCLQKEPARRYGSVLDLLAGLREIDTIAAPVSTLVARAEILGFNPDEDQGMPEAYLEDGNTGDRHKLVERVRIGRGSDNDIILSDPQVSAYHAEIHWEYPQFHLVDMHSTNGTYVGAWRMTTPIQLEDGMQIRMGNTPFIVHIAVDQP
jgi:serine/threonine protein kinase